MTTERLVSQSEVRTFKRCRRKWWLSHVRSLRPRRQTARLARDVGVFVHAAVAEYYRGKTDKEVLDDLFVALRTHHEAVMADVEPDDADDMEKELEQIASYAPIMVEGFMAWAAEEGIDAQYSQLDPEVEVRVPVSPFGRGAGVTLVGKQDAKMKDLATGDILFNEIKTVAAFHDFESTAAINEQLLHYQLLDLLMAQDTDDRVAGAVVTLIRRVKRTVTAKPPFFKRLHVYHNTDEVRSYFVRLAGTYSDMEDTAARLTSGPHQAAAYPTPDRSCAWECPFFDVCPMLDDPRSDAEGYLAEHFEVGDPYARYEEVDE